MDLALIASAGLMGLAGAPHCGAMCGAPCAALSQRCGRSRSRAATAGFLSGRLLGYMAGGAAVAGGVALFSALAGLAPALRPLWAAVHAAMLALGAWMLITGRLPAWLGDRGYRSPVTKAAVWQPVASPAQRGAALGPFSAGAAGTLWVAMPCGLLQSALIVAALASTPGQGAAAMGVFAAASSLGLLWFPLLWSQGGAGERATRWVLRASGALLLGASGWALGHGLWLRVAALCAGA